MNHKLFLGLIATSALASSTITLLLTADRASALQGKAIAPQASCDVLSGSNLESAVMQSVYSGQGRLIASSGGIPGEYPLMDFSAAESDAAVTLFGCDCLACIRALRQLRYPSLPDRGEGHCWTALQQRVSQQQIEDVLQGLEAETAIEDRR